MISQRYHTATKLASSSTLQVKEIASPRPVISRCHLYTILPSTRHTQLTLRHYLPTFLPCLRRHHPVACLSSSASASIDKAKSQSSPTENEKVTDSTLSEMGVDGHQEEDDTRSNENNKPPKDETSPSRFSYSQHDLDLSVPLPKLKYPVVLVHGYLGYASLIRSPLNGEPLFEYFGTVRKHLQQSSDGGITVITPVNPPAASIAARAKKLQMALGLKKETKVKETIVDGTDGQHTKRKPINNGNGESNNVSDSSEDHENVNVSKLTMDERSRIPIEFQHMGGGGDEPVAVNTDTGSIKTATDIRDERAAAREAKQSDDGSSIILGGQQISLNNYEGKFHLIAHSMGGLDCRYLISQLKGGDRIASLTTVASPHRGSPIADMVLDVIDVPFTFHGDPGSLKRAPTLNKFSQWLAGLFSIDVTGINNLTTTAMHEFNHRVLNHPTVKYFSYGGCRPFSKLSVWYLPSYWINRFEPTSAPLTCKSKDANQGENDATQRSNSVNATKKADFLGDALTSGSSVSTEVDESHIACRLAGGPNDGLVSINSARWGDYCGTTNLDHLEQIGLGVWNKHLPLYRQIIFRLAEIEKFEENDKEKQKAVETKKPTDRKE